MPSKRVLCTLCLLEGGKSIEQCMRSQANFSRHMDYHSKNEKLRKQFEAIKKRKMAYCKKKK